MSPYSGVQLALAKDKDLRSAMASTRCVFFSIEVQFCINLYSKRSEWGRVSQGLGENLINLSVFIYFLSKAVPKTTRVFRSLLGLRVLLKNEEVMNLAHTLVQSSFVGSLFNYFWPELAKCQNAQNI